MIIWQIRFRVKAAAKEAINDAVKDLTAETRDRINRVVMESPEDILAVLQAETSRIFDNEGIPPWTRLAENTIKKRTRGRSKRLMRVGKILQRTGSLKRAVLGGFRVMRKPNSTNSFVTFSDDVHPRLATHHFGLKVKGYSVLKDGTHEPWDKPLTIPSRPVLPIGREGQRVGRRIYDEIIIPRLNQPPRGR